MTISEIKNLEAGAILQAVSGAQFKIQSVDGDLIWLSQPDDFVSGWRCFSPKDLAALNVKAA